MAANPVGWHVYRYDLERPALNLPQGLSLYAPDLRTWIEKLGGRRGQRFLLGPDGLPDLRVNAFFASPTMRNLTDLTNRDYAYSLALWLNFLLVLGRDWWEATEDDATEFQFWRCRCIARTDRDMQQVRQDYRDLVDITDDPLAPSIRHERELHELERLRRIITAHETEESDQ
ncbi:hypothetical protein [Streptomyces sp. 1222.5]|uniref:hypothetical protein n=1 Tax=Streptomyces sp. 1222.5 TaxID=1881026 RepID=UPI003D74D066